MKNIGSASLERPEIGDGPQLSPSVVLVEPQLGENIGQAARAMANFGLRDLRLVAPRDGWPNDKALANAAIAKVIVENARVFETLDDAIGDLHYVFATTARVRDMVKPVMTPETATRDLQVRLSGGEKCGILFGRERSGLENDEVALANAIVMAPVDPAYASLNLAQSVLLMGYEWRKLTAGDSLGRATPYDGPAQEGNPYTTCESATREELIHFFCHIETELTNSGFFKTDFKRASMVRNIRNMFLRVALTSQEVRTLRGIVSALTRPRPNRNSMK
ncbi:MAG: RNA methyltransferase [Hyphomicrobiales bacterium]|nr:RNA methyltransferase [Hyphomicrobiales bacterium]